MSFPLNPLSMFCEEYRTGWGRGGGGEEGRGWGWEGEERDQVLTFHVGFDILNIYSLLSKKQFPSIVQQ
jgi:hypothetical protein